MGVVADAPQIKTPLNPLPTGWPPNKPPLPAPSSVMPQAKTQPPMQQAAAQPPKPFRRTVSMPLPQGWPPGDAKAPPEPREYTLIRGESVPAYASPDYLPPMPAFDVESSCGYSLASPRGEAPLLDDRIHQDEHPSNERAAAYADKHVQPGWAGGGVVCGKCGESIVESEVLDLAELESGRETAEAGSSDGQPAQRPHMKRLDLSGIKSMQTNCKNCLNNPPKEVTKPTRGLSFVRRLVSPKKAEQQHVD